MGVDTHLYLNSKHELRDIATVIERTAKTKVVIESQHNINPGYFIFQLPELKRMIHVHVNTTTPIGNCTLLDFSANEQAHDIFRKVADVFGGIFMDNDCDGQCEFIPGQLDENNALPYFIKYAIIHDGIEPDDIQALIKSMSDWYDRCDKSGKPNILAKLLTV